MKPFSFRVLTPKACYFEGEILSLVLPTEEGSIGFLRGREDCVVSVSDGAFRYTLPSGESVERFSDGGVAEMKGGVFTFCTAAAYSLADREEIRAIREAERAEEAMRQARSREEYTMYKVAMAKAFDKLKRSAHNNK